MKKKYSIKKLNELETQMGDSSQWEKANHTVKYKGPTSIRFSEDTLNKLNAIAHAKHKTISHLVNDYVKSFVEGEYEVLQACR